MTKVRFVTQVTNEPITRGAETSAKAAYITTVTCDLITFSIVHVTIELYNIKLLAQNFKAVHSP